MPFRENIRFAARNREKIDKLSIDTAIMADQTKGVVLISENFTLCMSKADTIRIATMLVDALDQEN